MKIVAVSDMHYSASEIIPSRKGHLGDLFLQRVVQRVNRWIKPDVAVLLGDMVDDPYGADAPALYAKLRGITERLECPAIFLPGNHDLPPKEFYRIFPDPGPFVDAAGTRFLIFHDPEEPGWNARRTPEDLERMGSAHLGHKGPAIALQHCPLFPPGTGDCCYNYTNAPEVVARMEQTGIKLSISAHYHPGVDLIHTDDADFVITPGLCEAPFGFLEIELRDERVAVKRHTLYLPELNGLIDCHVHTPFAYCSEDMDCARAITLAEAAGLAGVAFAEHTGQLYFDRDTYWKYDFLEVGADYPHGRDDRMGAYLAEVGREYPPAVLGLEADCDFYGHPVLRESDLSQISLLLGAIHWLPELRKPKPDVNRIAGEFMAALSVLVDSGIQVLPHPMRVFRRSGLPVPEGIFAPTARLLREHGVAAELNYHTNEPPEAFVRECLKAGVSLTFGSDAHALYEVGEFWPQLQLLSRCGFTGDLRDVLAPFARQV